MEVVADEDSSPRLSEMPLKQWQRDVPYAFDSFEDEDVCPTCLDGRKFPIVFLIVVFFSTH